jgi:hypothetical protein
MAKQYSDAIQLPATRYNDDLDIGRPRLGNSPGHGKTLLRQLRTSLVRDIKTKASRIEPMSFVSGKRKNGRNMYFKMDEGLIAVLRTTVRYNHVFVRLALSPYHQSTQYHDAINKYDN